MGVGDIFAIVRVMYWTNFENNGLIILLVLERWYFVIKNLFQCVLIGVLKALSLFSQENFPSCWRTYIHLRNPGTNGQPTAGPNGECSFGPDSMVQVADRDVGQDFVHYSTWTRRNSSWDENTETSILRVSWKRKGANWLVPSQLENEGLMISISYVVKVFLSSMLTIPFGKVAG